jgi:N-formylglutamate deformylase
MNKLPFLLSIPHGGLRKPLELDGHLCITDRDLFDDSDPFVIEIYDLRDKVQSVIKTDVARTFVDLNRSLQQMPPDNPDGLIKSMTCYEKPIYIKGKEPDKFLRDSLIEFYYVPYHKAIQKSISELDLKLCIDCHSMASVAPGISPDGANKKRPLFCLSNQDGKTCSNEMIELLADCISHSYSIDRKEISINSPFLGGYITKTYGNNPLPWIQVEMNRSLYLSPPWFNPENLSVEKTHLENLKNQFENSLELFFSKIS